MAVWKATVEAVEWESCEQLSDQYGSYPAAKFFIWRQKKE